MSVRYCALPVLPRLVPLIHVHGNEIEEQSGCEGGREFRVHRCDSKGTIRDPPEDLAEPREVQDVVQNFAHGFDDDREVLELAYGMKEIGCAKPLEPEGRPLARHCAWHQQCSAGILPELSAEQRRMQDLLEDHRFSFGGNDARKEIERDLVGVMTPEQDAVVVVQHLRFDPGPGGHGAGQSRDPSSPFTRRPKQQCSTTRGSPTSSRNDSMISS